MPRYLSLPLPSLLRPLLLLLCLHSFLLVPPSHFHTATLWSPSRPTSLEYTRLSKTVFF
jgi:hypothetical protein